MNKQKHTWVRGSVKNFSTSRSSPGNKPARRNRRKISAARTGMVCAGCKLVAVPPTKGAESWAPPLDGECQL